MKISDSLIYDLIKVPMEVKFPGAKKVGKTWMLRCPFHDDKTPSMSVTPEGIYYCFGCGEKGNYITYIKKLYGLDFPKALDKIQDITGIRISDHYSSEYQKIIEINDEAVKFYASCLTVQARQYLYRRGINDEAIRRFSLGYSNGGNDTLYNYLLKKGYTTNEIRMTGLLKTKSDCDYFGNRGIIIPIRNCLGIVGFAIRVLDENIRTKYFNTPNTKVFTKSKTLFGLDYQGIKDYNSVIIVEGYFDTIAMHQAGYRNTVGVMGTELSDDHIETLKKYANKIILAMDCDSVGKKATVKFLKKLIAAEFETEVVSFGDMDVDEFIYNGGDVKKILAGSESGEMYLYKALDEGAKKKLLYDPLINHKIVPVVISSFEERERGYLQEVSARYLIESLRESMKLVKVHTLLQVEVRRISNILVVFKDKKFICSRAIKDEKLYKEEASSLGKTVIKYLNKPSE